MPDRPTYLIAVHYVSDRTADVERLVDFLRSRATADLTIMNGLDVDALLDPEGRSAAIVVGSTLGPPSVADEVLTKLIDCKVPVIATFDPAHPFGSQAPPLLAAYNGFAWAAGDSETRLGTFLLRLLGLEEERRHAFISYRRHAGEKIARQLRRGLQNDGWDVFLDVFSIRPGADFQRELFRSLDSMTLLAVVESERTWESRWVDDELAFAATHGIGIRAVVLPSAAKSRARDRFPSRLRYSIADTVIRGDPDDPTVGKRIRDELVSDLQRANTDSYRLRTEDMIVNVSGFLTDRGRTVTRSGAATVVGVRGSQVDVAVASSRRPSFEDIRDASEAMDMFQTDGKRVRGWIVHRLTDPDPDYIDLVDQVARPHGVSVVRLLDFPTRVAE